MGYDLYQELERTCKRTEKELHDLNDRLEQNKNMMSPADLDILVKITDVIKDVKSTMKKIDEMEMMEEGYSGEGYSGAGNGGYSGEGSNYSGTYMAQPMWNRRMGYSGNSYRGSYTLESGNGGYSGARRGSSRGYSRASEREDLTMRLENMLNTARNDKEAESIRKALDALSD